MSNTNMVEANRVIRDAEIVWAGVAPCKVTAQEAREAKKRIVFRQERVLDGCPSKGAILREFEPFSFGEPLIHAEYEINDLEPQFPGWNYRFATVKRLPAEQGDEE